MIIFIYLKGKSRKAFNDYPGAYIKQ